MKSDIRILLFNILLFSSLRLSAQVSILVDSESKTSLPASSAGTNAASSTSVNVYKPALTPYHRIITINEQLPDRDLLSSDVVRTTYTDLSKLAANSVSNFLHTETQTLFPYNMGEFERKQIISYPNDPGKLSVIYTTHKEKSTFVINLTPTKEGTEGRLRNEYLKEIRKLSKEEDTDSLPVPNILKYIGHTYVCNGVQGIFVNRKSLSVAQCAVFECGTWMLGIKLKTSDLDSAQHARLEENLMLYFNPSRYTALSPLNLKSNVGFESEVMKDTETSSAMVNSAFKKLDWASRYVSSNERHSGFPDIYLAMHVASLSEYLRIMEKRITTIRNPNSIRFFEDLNAIKLAGFLPEFIMEEYDRVMIVPDDIQLNFEAYRQWKQSREIRSGLKEKKYTITYRNLPY